MYKRKKRLNRKKKGKKIINMFMGIPKREKRDMRSTPPKRENDGDGGGTSKGKSFRKNVRPEFRGGVRAEDSS